MARRLRDPATDPRATVPDFVYRLRRLGYPGTVRCEVPLYIPLDVRWCAKLVNDLSNELNELVRRMGPAGSPGYFAEPDQDESAVPGATSFHVPAGSLGYLKCVLDARALFVWFERELKRHTSDREAATIRKEADHA